MRVLVTWASRHGATQGIAEHVARTLEGLGLDVVDRPIEDADVVEPYDAVVVGASAYMFHWEKEAVTWVRRHAAELATRPVWLFTSGPLGNERYDKEGRDQLETAIPQEIPALAELVHAAGTKVFFGAYDPTAPPKGIGERLTRMMPAARDLLPAGDFRDWPAIEAWTREVAQAIQRQPVAVG